MTQEPHVPDEPKAHNSQPAQAANNSVDPDTQIEHTMGRLLHVGVLLAALVVLAGGVRYVLQHGAEPFERGEFKGEPEDLRDPLAIVRDAFSGRGRAIIQLGVLLLVATPVARVIFSVYVFGRQRDFLYVAITLIVLAVLMYSLFWDHG